MDGYLRQSTASQSRTVGPFISDTDFKTVQTGLTIANTDIKLMANGAASADKNSGGGTHRQSGHYGVTFDATDTATVGELTGSVVVAGALPVWFKFVVIEPAVYDALFADTAPGFATVAALATVQTSVDDLPTNAELATALGTADDAVLAAINDLPTNAELATALGTADDAVLAQVALVKAQTDLLPSDPADQSLIIAATNAIMTRLGTPVADVSTDIAAIKADTAATLVDTNELQTDWVNGGRLDNILDARASQTSVDDLPTNAELATALGTADDAVLTAINDLPTNAELATALGTADDAVLAQVALVKTVTDKLNTTLESVGSPTDYVFTTRALAQAPSGSGGTPPTVQEIVDGVWDEPLAGHLSAGSTGDQLNNAAAAGNPWASIIEGAYTAEDILRVIAAVIAGKSSVTTLGNGQAIVTFRNLADNLDMVTSNMNQSSRTSVTLGV